jgi:hypothetical protein
MQTDITFILGRQKRWKDKHSKQLQFAEEEDRVFYSTSVLNHTRTRAVEENHEENGKAKQDCRRIQKINCWWNDCRNH